MQRECDERRMRKREVRGHQDSDAPPDDINTDELYASCTSICASY